MLISAGAPATHHAVVDHLGQHVAVLVDQRHIPRDPAAGRRQVRIVGEAHATDLREAALAGAGRRVVQQCSAGPAPWCRTPSACCRSAARSRCRAATRRLPACPRRDWPAAAPCRFAGPGRGRTAPIWRADAAAILERDDERLAAERLCAAGCWRRPTGCRDWSPGADEDALAFQIDVGEAEDVAVLGGDDRWTAAVMFSTLSPIVPSAKAVSAGCRPWSLGLVHVLGVEA